MLSCSLTIDHDGHGIAMTNVSPNFRACAAGTMSNGHPCVRFERVQVLRSGQQACDGEGIELVYQA